LEKKLVLVRIIDVFLHLTCTLKWFDLVPLIMYDLWW